MAATLTDNKLVIRYKVGVNEAGRDIFKQQTLKNINPEVTDEKLVEISDLVAAVLDYSVAAVRKDQSFALSR
ncbi:DUF1659 domain-containing protein [Clostridium isatidis]|uniref:DUF1659 domain-containing protein n=1 Tax=Clostridium isatidis TaxID=182773 RepID=A0A343JA83_9CLOT|nr:DUF1659 domain-containing protein [Clostridium isatidis]ASW42441.1 hypothetical protein BEN51_02770 [Clostridium isatidis]NLZ34080.1 DUF1659 domain-containing protein [Clostridiales bacterium]